MDRHPVSMHDLLCMYDAVLRMGDSDRVKAARERAEDIILKVIEGTRSDTSLMDMLETLLADRAKKGS